MTSLDRDQRSLPAMDAFTAFVAALAIGAVWALVTLDRVWLTNPIALLAGAALALMLRLAARASVSTAILAALATLLAAFYAQCLGASARLSNELGLHFATVLKTDGLRATLELGAASLHWRDAAWIAAGMALAFILSLPHRRGDA